MSASMAEVLDAHVFDPASGGCRACGWRPRMWAIATQPGPETWGTHQAEVLAANGYGKLGLGGGIWTMTDAEFKNELATERAKALEDAAQELARLRGIGMRRSDLCTSEEKAAYRAYAEHDGDYSEWLLVRAATERDGKGQ